MSAPDDVVWYISRDGQRVGPLTADEFARFEEDGRLRPTDQVWQTGMTAWVAYRDYGARETAARFVGPRPPSPSTKRSGLRAMTNALKGALQSVSKQLAKIRSVPAPKDDADALSARAPKNAPSSIARLSADPHPVSIQTPPVGAPEPSLRQLVSRLAQPASGLIEDESNQHPGGIRPDIAIDAAAVPSGPPMSTARLVSEAQAAALIGLELATFRAWVANGRLPRALPDCGKYDMKAIHLALDCLSGIAIPEREPNARSPRLATNKN